MLTPNSPLYRKLEIDPDLDPSVINRIVLIRSIVFLVVSLLVFFVIWKGVNLIEDGISSDSEISFKVNGIAKVELNKAYPGITMILAAIILEIVAIPRMSIKK